MPRKINLSASLEDYLEAIASLKKDKGIVRVKDIGQMLGVRNSSVVSALNSLAKYNLVEHERYGYVELTLEGSRRAKDIQRRHDTICKFLTNILKIEPKIAADDACKMEHAISAKTLNKLTKFIAFVENCPKGKKYPWHNFKIYSRAKEDK